MWGKAFVLNRIWETRSVLFLKISLALLIWETVFCKFQIMKLDEDVKMISAEAPVLFAKAAEIFITELTMRAWIHTEDNKRRTLQRNDIAMAITKYDQFDFLIDIVPRDDIKPTATAAAAATAAATKGGREDNSVRMVPEQVSYYFQLAQQQQQQQVQVPTSTAVTPASGNQQQQAQQQQQPQVRPQSNLSSQNILLSFCSTLNATDVNDSR